MLFLNLVLLIIASFATQCDNAVKIKTPQLDRRILGGFPVDIWKTSYITSIIIRQELRLKGAANIISRHWAVTTAYTMAFISEALVAAGHVYVRGNTSFWKGEHGFYRDHKVVKLITHEKYDVFQSDYDVALLKVLRPFDGVYEKKIRVAPPNYQYKIGTSGVMVGWGTVTTNTDSIDPYNRLTYALVKLKRIEQCRPYFPRINNRMICAATKGRDSCVHDIGNPLVQNGLLIGLVSWAQDGSDAKSYGVFIKLSKYYRWIKNKTQHRKHNY